MKTLMSAILALGLAGSFSTVSFADGCGYGGLKQDRDDTLAAYCTGGGHLKPSEQGTVGNGCGYGGLKQDRDGTVANYCGWGN